MYIYSTDEFNESHIFEILRELVFLRTFLLDMQNTKNGSTIKGACSPAASPLITVISFLEIVV